MDNQIIWNDRYKTGNETIDQQHKMLFELANQVIDPTNDPQATHHKLLALQHYVKEHFDEEELMMKQCNIPDYSEHVADHDDLLKQLDDIGTEIITNELGISEIKQRIQHWLVDHFFEKDLLLADYLNTFNNQD
jgi:hemerythrin